MSQFHLRPVADNSLSSSPTASTSSSDRPSSHKTSPVSSSSSSSSHHSSTRPRRPLSPSSIRDLDLSRTSDIAQRKYPAPPTGHELMAMFPPAPPETPLETRGGPTSGFFQRQERAFFAQAGKEIFRVRVEIDMAPHAPEMEGAHVKTRPRDVNAPHAWPPPLPAHPPPNGSLSHHSSAHAASSPVALANPNGRPNQRSGVSITPGYPVNTHSPTLHHPPNLHSSPAGMTLRTPTQEAIPAASQRPKTEFPPEEFDPDEAWRRPIPYAERRRAGKHTKRVIVRS